MKIPVSTAGSQLPSFGLCVAMSTNMGASMTQNVPMVKPATNRTDAFGRPTSSLKPSKIPRRLTRARYNLLMKDQAFLAALPAEDLQWFRNLFKHNEMITTLDVRTAIYLRSIYAKTRNLSLNPNAPLRLLNPVTLKTASTLLTGPSRPRAFGRPLPQDQPLLCGGPSNTSANNSSNISFGNSFEIRKSSEIPSSLLTNARGRRVSIWKSQENPNPWGETPLWELALRAEASQKLARGLMHESVYDVSVAELLNRISADMPHDGASETLAEALISSARPALKDFTNFGVVLSATRAFLKADADFLKSLAEDGSASVENNFLKLVTNVTELISQLGENAKASKDFAGLQGLAEDMGKFIENFITETYRLASEKKRSLVQLHNQECSNLQIHTFQTIQKMLKYQILQYLRANSGKKLSHESGSGQTSGGEQSGGSGGEQSGGEQSGGSGGEMSGGEMSGGSGGSRSPVVGEMGFDDEVEELVRSVYGIPDDVERKSFERLIEVVTEELAVSREDSVKSPETFSPMDLSSVFDRMVKRKLKYPMTSELLDVCGEEPTAETLQKYLAVLVDGEMSRTESLSTLLEALSYIQEFITCTEEYELLGTDESDQSDLKTQATKTFICLQHLAHMIFDSIVPPPLQKEEKVVVVGAEKKEEEWGVDESGWVDNHFEQPPPQPSAPLESEVVGLKPMSLSDRKKLAQLVHLKNVDSSDEEDCQRARSYLEAHEQFVIEHDEEAWALAKDLGLDGRADGRGDGSPADFVSLKEFIYTVEDYVKILYGFDNCDDLTSVHKDIFNFAAAQIAMKVYLRAARKSLKLKDDLSVGHVIRNFLHRPALYSDGTAIDISKLELFKAPAEIQRAFAQIRNRYE